MNMRVASPFLLLLLSTAAARGDDAPPPAPAFNWTGVYAGIDAGYQWTRVDYSDQFDHFGVPVIPRIHGAIDGFSGGGLVGYNYQTPSHIVLGIEADAGLGDLSRGASGNPFHTGNYYSAFNIDWNLHTRGRIGYALGATLFYIAGGLAVTELSIDDRQEGYGHADATYFGWTIGAGVEHALTQNWSIGIEYLYDDFGRRGYAIGEPIPFFGPKYHAEADLTAQTVRASIRYRF